jgi:protein-S-isoprenylcysteine O-methyltransferase Ste14
MTPLLLPTLVVYVLLAGFLVIERLLRRGHAALTLKPGAADRGSTLFVGLSFGVGLLAVVLAPLLNADAIGLQLPPLLRWIGVVLMVLAVLLRIWASRTLGAFYTRTLVVGAQQRLIQAGPYRLVRHPGYLGTLVLWIGAGIAAGNGMILGGIAVLFLVAYGYRVRVEEVMLTRSFGEAYRQYARRTWKLIPFLY